MTDHKLKRWQMVSAYSVAHFLLSHVSVAGVVALLLFIMTMPITLWVMVKEAETWNKKKIYSL